MTPSPIKSILIVGGGTAGWSAAACLSQFLKGDAVDITLVESTQIGTVGVGEASVPNIRNFNQFIGLSEMEFIKSTQASFKLGIRFDDWTDPGATFFHPFGTYGTDLGGVDFYECFLHAKRTQPDLSIGDYSLSSHLAASGKFSQPILDHRSPLSDFGYAYHFDATLYAKALKDVSLARHVKTLDAKVSNVKLDPENGHITALDLEDGRTLHADLFIDCTGFRAVLIGDALKTPYQSWQKWLPCDRAVAVKCHADPLREISPYTVTTAQPAGWSWRIPLQTQIGHGYVYSSAFETDENASHRLQHTTASKAHTAPVLQKFTPGMRSQFWNKNCVSLGLASGFIEPLESTSINLVHRALSILMEYFPDKTTCTPLINEANTQYVKEQERVRDFIILHYVLSPRRDTPFWRAFDDMTLPCDLSRKIDLFKARGKILQLDYESFETASWITLYEGLGIAPETLNLRLSKLPQSQILSQFQQIQTSLKRSALTAQSHQAFLTTHNLRAN